MLCAILNKTASLPPLSFYLANHPCKTDKLFWHFSKYREELISDVFNALPLMDTPWPANKGSHASASSEHLMLSRRLPKELLDKDSKKKLIRAVDKTWWYTYIYIVCMCACIYIIWLYIYVKLCTFTHPHTYTHAHIYARKHIHIHTHTRVVQKVLCFKISNLLHTSKLCTCLTSTEI